MSPRQFAALAGAAGLLLAAALVTVVTGGSPWAIAMDKWWQVGIGLVGFGGYLGSARRSSGAERRWRLWMAAAMASLIIGMVTLIWSVPVNGPALPSTPVVPIAFIMVPVLAMLGVLNLVHDEPARRPEPAGRRRSRVLLGLDTLIICGSAFVLVLVATLQSVFRAWPPNGPAVALVITHPVAFLVLLAVLGTLARTQRVICQPPILLLSLAAVAESASGWAFAVLIGNGATQIPPVADIGFIACPVLLALAAFAPFRPKPAGQLSSWPGDYVMLAVPYLPLGVAFLLVAVSTAMGEDLAPLEVEVGLVVMGLVILRQLVTLVDNARLLKQVTESQRQLEHQAYHDPLTGLANRTLFLSRLADSVAVHDRDQRPLVLLFVDIDGFKTVNDNFGHGAGDAVLRTVAERLRTTVRDGDLVARLGGDEFSVLLDSADCDNTVQSRRISQQLLDTLCAPQVVRGRDVCISASIGTVTLSAFDPDLTPDELLRRAVEAMYAAKRRGKGALVVYDDMAPATPSTDRQTDGAHA
ncbi:MAG TPA: GGDEF domain-containing protein [Pseudonocardiaceae bacterium]